MTGALLVVIADWVRAMQHKCKFGVKPAAKVSIEIAFFSDATAFPPR